MHIAVLLSGRIYTPDYEKTMTRFKSLFKGHDPIFFISLNKPTNEDNPQDHIVFTERFLRDLNIPEECVNIQTLKLPAYIYTFKKKEESSYFNVYSMFYHNIICFSLLQKYMIFHNIAFDIVLKIRTDIIFKNIINFEKNMTNQTVYIPFGYDFNGINDQVAYGNYNSMFVYCSCVYSLKTICENGTLFHPETILSTYLQNRQIQISRFVFPYHIK